MSLGQKIAKNALLLMAATTGQKLVAFLAFTIVVRLTGPQVTGAYFYAVSVTSVFVTLSDLGMTPVVIRAIAGADESSEKLFQLAIRAKMILVPIAILASLGYGVAMHESPEIMAAIAVCCVAMGADAFHLLLYGTLRGRQDLKPEAIGMFVGQCLTATGAITAAALGYGPIGLAAALAVGSLWNVFWALRRAKPSWLPLTANLGVSFRHLAYQAMPFAIAGISVKVYSYVDSLMLNAFKGQTAVGYYAVAYKLTYAMQFLPLTFTAALYPALSEAYAKKEHDTLRKVFMGSLRLLAAVGFPITAGLSALAPRVIPFFYGAKFAASIPAMSVLPWVLLPIFMDFAIGSLLNGSNRAHLKTTAMVATMLMNTILNAILVPLYGPVGAAWAGVFSFWFLLFIGMVFTARDAGGIWNIIWILLRALFAAAMSWLAWVYVGTAMPLIMAAIFGGAVAVAMAFLVKLVTVQDVVPIWRKLRNRFSGGEIIHES